MQTDTNTSRLQRLPVDYLEELAARKPDCRVPRCARDIMTEEIQNFTLDDSIRSLREFMENKKVRHALVFDPPNVQHPDPQFVGVVSQRDVLRLAPQTLQKSGPEAMDAKAIRSLLGLVVTRNPHAVSVDTSIGGVIQTMVEHRIDLLPVLSAGHVQGIITTTDVLKLCRTLHQVILKARGSHDQNDSWERVEEEQRNMDRELMSWVFRPVSEIMTGNFVFSDPQDTLGMARTLLQRHRFRHLLILNEAGKLVGVLSDRDILRNLPFTRKSPDANPDAFRDALFEVDPRAPHLQISLEEIMSKKVQHIPPSADIWEAAAILRRKKIGCLPVITENGNLVGIVTITDVMLSLARLYMPPEDIAQILPQGQGSLLA